MSNSFQILVDADACPVKQEIYKVAIRHQIKVKIVANSYFKIPENNLFESIIVNADFDAADNYVADNASRYSIVVTSDIVLADRCLKNKAIVLAPNGKAFTDNSIGSAKATRAIMEDLRASGLELGSGQAFSKKDRSYFLAKLHESILKLKS